ncbi:MAG TPA: serine/threonine-protein kinase [Solirubrobacteraceae bacterium]|nr:serine/threonine-protein kinase [Solirubrobacteraceae bacterium]
MLEPGTRIAGFRIDGYLASGGMGTVYLATQLSLGRVVALKVLSANLSQDEAFHKRFRREAMLQATLEHPNIVPVYEAGESSYGLFIAMRLVDGPNLKQLIGTLEVSDALDLLRGIARALDAAHAAGLIHRDVKPQNILVAGGDHAYLADFGLTTAAGVTSVTTTGQFVGTPDYVSPEQIRDEEPDARSDLYSLGAVLFECLSGAVPFPRSSKIATMYAHLEQPPPSVRTLAPELPVELDAVFARALAKRREDRYASAAELIAAARRALEARAAVPAPVRAATLSIKTSARSVDPTGVTSATQAIPARATAATEVVIETQPQPPPRWPAPAPAPRAPRRRRWRAPRGVGLLAAACGVATLAGFLAGRGGEEAGALTPTRQLSHDGVSVEVPASWGSRRVSLPELFAGANAAAGPASATRGVVAVGTTVAFGPSLVPKTLRDVAAVPALGTAVKLPSGLQGRLYDVVGRHHYEVLLVPRRGRVAVAACVAPTFAAGGGLFAGCEHILNTVRVTGAAHYPLDPRAGYAGFLNPVLGRLSAQADAGLGDFAQARDPGAQRAAANGLADAYATAAAAFTRALGAGIVSPPETGAHVAVRDSLAQVSQAYRDIAGAARRHDPIGYTIARAEVAGATQQLGSDLDQLAKLGYQVS